MGPGLNKAGKSLSLLTHSDDMDGKVNNLKATIKSPMKKVQCLSVAVESVKMDEDHLVQIVHSVVNFLLKKHCQNVRSRYI